GRVARMPRAPAEHRRRYRGADCAAQPPGPHRSSSTRPVSAGKVARALSLAGSVAGGFDPVYGLHAGDRDQLAEPVRMEDRRLALADLEPVLAEGVEDIGLVGDDKGVLPGSGP